MKVPGPPLNGLTGAATQVPAPGLGVLADGLGLGLELADAEAEADDEALGLGVEVPAAPVHTTPLSVNCAGTASVPE